MIQNHQEHNANLPRLLIAALATLLALCATTFVGSRLATADPLSSHHRYPHASPMSGVVA